MPSADEQAFLDAILATPDDDTPRLVFADWLDERAEGDDSARAALIRAQCQLEHLAPNSKLRRELAAQVKAILKEHEPRWAKELRDSKLVRGWEFRRGFIDGVTMSATTFAHNAERLFEIAPTIRTARFPDASNEVGRLATCERLDRLTAVDIRNMCGCGHCPIQNDLRALFASKNTPNLTKLNIAGNRMNAAGAKRLASSSALANVTDLDLSSNPLEGDGVRALRKAKHLTKLTTLDLSDARLWGSAEALAELTNLPALKHLRLHGNAMHTADVEALVAWPLFAQLESLDLSANPIGAGGVWALAKLPATVALQSLDVRRCGLTAPAAVKGLRVRFGKKVKV